MTDWFDQAACKGCDPQLFHPERGANVAVREAKKVCHGCPVQQECLEWALEHDERLGVWGGMSERQRRRIRNKDGRSRRGVKVVCGDCRMVFAAGSASAKLCGQCRQKRQSRRTANYPPTLKECVGCGGEFKARTPTSVRCRPCQVDADRETKRRWRENKRRAS